MAKRLSRRSAFGVSGRRNRGEVGAPRKLKVRLTRSDRGKIKALLRRGRHHAQVIQRAQVLQALDAGQSPEEAGKALRLSGTMARKTGWKYVSGRLEKALLDYSIGDD